MRRKLWQERTEQAKRKFCLGLIRMGWWYCEECGKYHMPFRLKIEAESYGCFWTTCLKGMRKVAVDNLGDYGTTPEDFIIWNLKEPETEAERFFGIADKERIIARLERREKRSARR
ncbi:MAG: hypothetical protein GX418_12100 [Clostridiales bacterium]|nr:hypothetical protein [Clostridiales bacterium]